MDPRKTDDINQTNAESESSMQDTFSSEEQSSDESAVLSGVTHAANSHSKLNKGIDETLKKLDEYFINRPKGADDNNTALIEQIRAEMNALQTKFILYNDNSSGHKTFQDWCAMPKTAVRFEKILAAANALTDINNEWPHESAGDKQNNAAIGGGMSAIDSHGKSASTYTGAEVAEVEKRVLDILHNELFAARVLTIKKLADDENSLATVNGTTSTDAKHDKQERYAEIGAIVQEKKGLEKRLAVDILKKPISAKYAGLLAKDGNSNLAKFIHTNEVKKGLKTRGHFQRADKAADALGAFADGTALGVPVGVTTGSITSSTAAGLSNSITSIGSGMWTVASGAPIVAGVALTLSTGLDFAKSMMKKQGMSDRAIKGTTFAIIAAAAACTIAFPVAAAALTAVMVATTTITGNVMPFFKLGKQIKQREAEVKATEDRVESLINSENASDIKLNEREQHSLMSKLDKYASENRVNPDELIAAKSRIQSGDGQLIEKNQLLKNALGLNDKRDLRKALIDNNRNHLSSLDTEIKNLRTERRSQGAQAINGLVTTVGAIMVAIPFPPVMIAGAAILITSSLVGIALKRDLFRKAWNKIKSVFKSGDDKAGAESSETNDNSLTNDKDLTHDGLGAAASQANSMRAIANGLDNTGNGKSILSASTADNSPQENTSEAVVTEVKEDNTVKSERGLNFKAGEDSPKDKEEQTESTGFKP